MYTISENLRCSPILLAFAKLQDPDLTFAPGSQGSSTRTGKHLGMEYRFNYIHVLGGIFMQGTVENVHFIIHAPSNQNVLIFTGQSLETVCKQSVEGFSDLTAHRNNFEQIELLSDFPFDLALVERRMDKFKELVKEGSPVKETMELRNRILLADVMSRLLVAGKTISGIDERVLKDNQWLIQKNDWRDDHIRITQGLKEIKFERNLAGNIVITVNSSEASFSGRVMKDPIFQMFDNDQEIFDKALEMVSLL